MSRPVITLTTDFGQADGYVAAMKGVILGLCPDAIVIDVSHTIPPQSVLQAAYVLATIIPYYPPGTVHLAVVDPGVGTERRAIAVRARRALYVAPDNGLLSLALALDPAHEAAELLPGPQPLSATFHGRDLFAPAAARLACGASLAGVGRALPLHTLIRLPGLRPERQPDGSWLGQVLHADHFGNLVTNFQFPMPESDAPAVTPFPAGGNYYLSVGGTTIVGLCRTFGDVEIGEMLAYVGSSGYLEIAVRDGSAAARLGIGAGAPVRVVARNQVR